MLQVSDENLTQKMITVKWIALELECEDMHLTQEVLVLIIVGVKVKTWKTFILVLASTVIKIAFLIARRRTF